MLGRKASEADKASKAAQDVVNAARLRKYGRRVAIGATSVGVIGGAVGGSGMYVHNRNNRMKTVNSNPHGMYDY